MRDRSSRPRSLRNPTPARIAERIIILRRQRLTGAHIAQKTGVSPATVSRVLRRAGLSKLRDLEPAEPVRRYERKHPGELIHLDIKRLGKFERTGHRITGDRTGQSGSRGIGWEYVHVCIDDASRLAFTQVHPDEKAVSAVQHLKAAVAWYASMGVTVTRVMTPSRDIFCENTLPGNGQWQLLQIPRLQSRVHQTGAAPYPHQTLHAEDQWKSRTVHPDRPA